MRKLFDSQLNPESINSDESDVEWVESWHLRTTRKSQDSLRKSETLKCRVRTTTEQRNTCALALRVL